MDKREGEGAALPSTSLVKALSTPLLLLVSCCVAVELAVPVPWVKVGINCTESAGGRVPRVLDGGSETIIKTKQNMSLVCYIVCAPPVCRP